MGEWVFLSELDAWTKARQDKTTKSFGKPRELGCMSIISLVVRPWLFLLLLLLLHVGGGTQAAISIGENPPASCPARSGRGEHHYYLLRPVCVSMIPAIALNTHQRELLLPLLLVGCGSLSLSCIQSGDSS